MLMSRPRLGSGGWSSIWTNSDWFKSYTSADTGVPLYFPHLNVGGAGFGGGGFYWDQRPKGEAFNGKISQQRGSHYLKAGLEFRQDLRRLLRLQHDELQFQHRADREHLQQSGHSAQRRPVGHLPAWRARRLVADDRRSGARSAHEVLRHVLPGRLEAQSRVTLNLGIRNDYESPWYDPAHNFSRGLDLSQPVPEMPGETAGDAVGSDRRSSATTIGSGTASGTGRPRIHRACGTRRSWHCSRGPASPSA